MSKFSTLAAASAIAAASLLAFTAVGNAQSAGGGNYGGGGAGGAGAHGGAPEIGRYGDPKKGFNPSTHRIPPSYYRPVVTTNHTCELLRMQITPNNALVTTPRYRECLRRNGQTY